MLLLLLLLMMMMMMMMDSLVLRPVGYCFFVDGLI
jgi:hypothetical protein